MAQVAAEVARLPRVQGMAAAACASPAPKVFTTARGLETFSTGFTLAYTDVEGRPREVAVTPVRYAGLRGPYNRRNVYGAALAFGPVLASDPRTRPLFAAVARHACAGDAPLLRDLGVDPGSIRGPIQVRYAPQGSMPVQLPWTIEIGRGP